jgi:hypothetical protein
MNLTNARKKPRAYVKSQRRRVPGADALPVRTAASGRTVAAGRTMNLRATRATSAPSSVSGVCPHSGVEASGVGELRNLSIESNFTVATATKGVLRATKTTFNDRSSVGCASIVPLKKLCQLRSDNCVRQFSNSFPGLVLAGRAGEWLRAAGSEAGNTLSARRREGRRPTRHNEVRKQQMAGAYALAAYLY